MPRYSWTQPACRGCFDIINPGREPHVLVTPEPEICCVCGTDTLEGIYIRVNPQEVSHPTRLKD